MDRGWLKYIVYYSVQLMFGGFTMIDHLESILKKRLTLHMQ